MASPGYAVPIPREDRPAAAISLMLLAFLFFATMDTTAKWLVTHGVPVLQVSFLRYAVHFLTILLLFGPRYGRELMRSRAPAKELLRAAFLLGSTVFNFMALAYLPLTVTTAIFFASPLAVCVLAIPVLGEKVGPRRWTAIVIGFIGVLVITQPWSADFHWAMFLSLGALLCAALYFVMTRALAGIDHNMTMQFYASGLAAILLAPPGFAVWTWPESPLPWALLVMLGLLGGIGHMIATTAHRLAPASTLAPLIYSQILYITFYSYTVFAQLPDQATILGTAIIVGSGLYLWARERQVKAAARRHATHHDP
ncbi:MAG TPA: DMT family transporter [Paracoccaceae bacterium]|nr:DMT family transporter [Paracoccaceae bacterium]